MTKVRTNRSWRWLERILLVGGLLALATAGAMVGYGRVADWAGAAELEEITASAAPAGAGTGLSARVPRPPAGSLLGRIEIPRHEMTVLVREGMTESTLMKGAGHVPWTKLPGEPGNAVFLAHRDMHFRPLKGIEKGDLVWFTGLDRIQMYSVTETHVVKPGEHTLLEPNTADRLTLLTCYPFSYIGPAPLRFVVVARPVGPARPLAARASAAGDVGTASVPDHLAAR